MNNDPLHIKYRGFLTFRGLRLIALVLMTLSQMGSIVVPAHRLCLAYQVPFILQDAEVRFFEFMAGMSQASFALIMVSSLGLVLSRQMSFKKQLIEYFVLAVVTYLVTVLLLSNMILDILRGLPSKIGYIQQLLSKLNFTQVSKGLLIRTLQLIMPGDGTVHPEALGNVTAALGLSVSVPDIDTIISLVPQSIIDHEWLRSFIAGIASQDLTPYVGPAVDRLSAAVDQITPQLMSIIDSTVIPKLQSMIFGMLNFNVFWNLFLYTLFYFFIMHQPKTKSPGRRMLFRCCAVFPGGWMLLSFLISSQLRLLSTFTPPVWLVAMLSNIKPSVMSLFFLLVVFEKYNELEFSQSPKYKGLTIDRYFSSSMASLQFSIGTSVLIVIISIVDWLLGMIPGLTQWGFGHAKMMWVCAPFLLLYSFNKMPKHKVLNGVITVYYFAHYFWIFLCAVVVICSVLGMISGVMPFTGL